MCNETVKKQNFDIISFSFPNKFENMNRFKWFLKMKKRAQQLRTSIRYFFP